MIYVKWLLLFIPVLAVEFLAYVLTPLVALFIVKRERTDRVKLIDNKQHTMMREYLIPSLYYFQTHDNAVDEYWYGAYFLESKLFKNLTQEDYDNKAWIRYLMRCMWMFRNTGYGFMYNWFSVPVEEQIGYRKFGNVELEVYPSSFKLSGMMDFKYFKNSLNIGWKAHKGFPRKMYANRIIGIRLR